MTDTIVSGNTAGAVANEGPDFDGLTYLTTYKTDIRIDDLVGNSKPLLGPLAANGGPTETMALLPGSPAMYGGGPVTTLTNNIGGQDTIVPVADAAAIASTALSWPIQIDGEQLTVTNVDLVHNTLTVVRPASGATAHKENAGVYFAYDQRGDLSPVPTPDIGAYQHPAGPAASLSVSVGSAAQTAGMSFTVTIKALDAAKHVAFGDQDTITLTSSDKEMTAMQVPLVNGRASPTITLDKAIRSATFTVSDNGKFTTTSNAFSIAGAEPVSGTLKGKSTVTAGVAFSVTMSGAVDAYGNPANGSVDLAASDFGDTGDGSGTMKVTNGSGTASVTLTIVAPNIKEQASNPDYSPLAATSGVITVTPAAAKQLRIGASSSTVTTGSPWAITLTAEDIYGNTCTNSGWDGKANVSLSTTPTLALTAPATAQFTKGVSSSISVTFTAGTLNDAQIEFDASATRPKAGGPALTVSGFINTSVTPMLATTLVVTGPSPSQVTPGIPFKVTFTTEDAKGVPTPDYYDASGNQDGGPLTVNLYSTDGESVSPAVISFTQSTTVDITLGISGAGTTFRDAPPLSTTQIVAIASGYTPAGDQLQVTSSQITVSPDWFSQNIPNQGIQETARGDFYSNTPNGLNFEGMLNIFQQAEEEYAGGANASNIQLSLQTLLANGSNTTGFSLNMPAPVIYLATQVIYPKADDVSFLATYFNNNPLEANQYQIEVQEGNSGPTFTGQNVPSGVADASQLAALVAQWFLGTVYPGTTGDTGVGYDPSSGDSYKSVTGTLWSPGGLPALSGRATRGDR